MAVHQTSSVLDEMSSTLANEDQMADNMMTMLPIQLTNATGTYLQHLNEDCLLEIFSRNPLTPMDMCSLAETCKRFKQITQRIFSKGFAIESRRCMIGKIIYTFSSKDHSELKCTFQDTERILKNFGPHLSELHMEKNLSLVNLIAKYCDDITLKRLKLRFLKRIQGVTKQLNSIFQRLLQLCVYECNLPIEPWDMNCDSLIELEISYCENSAALLSKTFPILERFCFHSDDGYGSTGSTREKNNIEALSEFVRRHGCLKSIVIYGELFDICKLLHAISCSCNELVQLTLAYLRYSFFDISHLQNLAKLNVLKIRFQSDQYEPYDRPQCEEIDFSQAFKSLKTMEISFEDDKHEVPNQIFDVLSRLQDLHELKLMSCDLSHISWGRLTQLRKLCLCHTFVQQLYGSNLLDVIRQLINLEEFRFSRWEGSLTEGEFSKIVKIVERRAHVLTLICCYDFIYGENCNEKRKVKIVKH